ncbi:MAG: molybdopterin-dependent oxidoreductase [Gammaproteobacteria bacterium]|nr:molybdopterin-dependent oxidoreductase [Gammaproteobacteria bacterium]
MLQNPRKAYLLLNVEPELDCANPIAAVNALKQAECVIALSLFKNPILEQYAHVILPIGTFAETAGTFVNVEGKWQGFQGVATPFAETRPAWKVLRVLGNFLHLNHFEYTDVEAVTAEIKSLLTQNSVKKDHQIKNKFNDNSLSSENKINDVNILDIQMNKNKLISNKTVYRIGEIPMYSVDNLVRHATALQETQAIVEGDVSIARLHPLTASQLNIKEKDIVIFKQHENKVHLPIMFDERIPEHAVLIAGGIPATSGLSELFGEIEVEH